MSQRASDLVLGRCRGRYSAGMVTGYNRVD